MESKRNETFGKVIFGKKAIQETWSACQEINKESTRQGGAHPPGRALHPSGRLEAPLTCTPSLLGVFWSKKNHRESFIPFGLHLVFLFFKTLKQGKKQKLALGSRLIG